MRDDYQRKMKEIFIVVKHHGAIVIGIIFDPQVLTRTRRIENHASCIGYPDGQTNCPTF
jgi:hypothetical protein